MSFEYPEKPFKVISFDLDNTIWDNDPVIERANKKERAHFEKKFPQVLQHLQENKDHLKTLRKKVNVDHPDSSHDFNFVRKKIYEYLAAHLKLEDDHSTELVESTFKVFDEARQDVHENIYPGVLEMLKRLKSHGLILVACTNGTAVVDRIPTLSELFDFHISAITAGALKPHKAPFEQLLELTKVEKHEVLHVGDNIIDDVKGSLEFGIRAVWVDDRLQKVKYGHVNSKHLPNDEAKKKLHVASVPSAAHILEVIGKYGYEVTPNL